MFSAAWTGKQVSIEAKMNGAKYRESLDENRLQGIQDFSFTFQQEWLWDKSLNVLKWPSQSPDLNLIEHLCKDLQIAVQQCSPSKLTELERICKEELEKLPK